MKWLYWYILIEEKQANFTRIGELHLTPGRVTSRGREEKLSEESRNSSRNPVWSNEKLQHPLTSYPIRSYQILSDPIRSYQSKAGKDIATAKLASDNSLAWTSVERTPWEKMIEYLFHPFPSSLLTKVFCLSHTDELWSGLASASNLLLMTVCFSKLSRAPKTIWNNMPETETQLWSHLIPWIKIGLAMECAGFEDVWGASQSVERHQLKVPRCSKTRRAQRVPLSDSKWPELGLEVACTVHSIAVHCFVVVFLTGIFVNLGLKQLKDAFLATKVRKKEPGWSTVIFAPRSSFWWSLQPAV